MWKKLLVLKSWLQEFYTRSPMFSPKIVFSFQKLKIFVPNHNKNDLSGLLFFHRLSKFFYKIFSGLGWVKLVVICCNFLSFLYNLVGSFSASSDVLMFTLYLFKNAREEKTCFTVFWKVNRLISFILNCWLDCQVPHIWLHKKLNFWFDQ